MRARLNRLWRAGHAALYRAIAPFPETTLLDPRYLYQVHVTAHVRELGARLSGLVLDVGCGEQPYRRYLGGRVVGLDHPASPGGMRGGCPAVYADATALPLRDRSVDGVTAIQVLEHVPSPLAVLREAARVLTPLGQLLLVVPQSYPVHAIPHDYWRWTLAGLTRLLRDAGFIIHEARRAGGFGAHAGLHCNVYLWHHAFEAHDTYAARVLFGALKVALLPGLLLGILLVNLLGRALDAAHDVPYYASHWTVLAGKGR